MARDVHEGKEEDDGTCTSCTRFHNAHSRQPFEVRVKRRMADGNREDTHVEILKLSMSLV